MKVMLLAAGKGTRMLPLTQHTPKPLLQAGGRSLVEHQILKLKAAGFREFVINHAWLGEQLEAALGDGARLGVQIRWSPEDEPLETAGGILEALPLLGDGPFAVVNADVWTDYPFARLRDALAPGLLAHLVLVPNPGHNVRGDFVLADDGAPALHGAAAGQALTFSGIAVYDPRLFAGDHPRKCALLPFLQHAIAAQRASAERYEGVWQDIGTPERLQALDLSLKGASHE
jgi:MurNAc alpha-1-phosphate uridylyltransferase